MHECKLSKRDLEKFTRFWERQIAPQKGIPGSFLDFLVLPKQGGGGSEYDKMIWWY